MQFQQLIQSVFELDRLLNRLRETVEPFGVPPPEQQQWYALLKDKLVPQLLNKQYLIVALAGGTNTGKSLLFNHIAGESVSAVDYRASGTKHPVCAGSLAAELAPPYFESFKLIPWENADQPLKEDTANFLYWKEVPTVPDNLLLLDTPDIDSDREVNWERAKAIRNAADVIIAVLTEQKYNDAAVRQFFREASAADKPVIVLFNMFDLKNDAEQLPQWLSQFCNETHTNPFAVFVAPFDKEKAAQRTLPFYEYKRGQFDEVNLVQLMSALHFDAVKSQTLLGALNVINNPDSGLPSYLKTIGQTAERFGDALQTLEKNEDAVVEWPALPATVLTEELRTWWNSERPNWSQKINGVYHTVSKTLTVPIRKLSAYVAANVFGAKISAAAEATLDNFQTLEQRAVIDLAGSVIQRLEKLAATDNPVLKREIDEWVGGEQRSNIIERSLAILNSLEPVSDDFRSVLRQHLTDWSAENPKSALMLRYLDNAATVCRPVITLTLAGGGVVFGSHIIGPMVTDALLPAAVGEAALGFGTEGISGSAAKFFRSIQEEFVRRRSKQFFDAFREQLWQTVIEKLCAGAALTDNETFILCKNWNTQCT
ncbi:MAG: GTPase domain-containing protein [Planctomycetaceae bacterium]|jgi:hypothetical protein|nr:GTPase domain-containing protein [Planctomycetaceae bacterium]